MIDIIKHLKLTFVSLNKQSRGHNTKIKQVSLFLIHTKFLYELLNIRPRFHNFWNMVSLFFLKAG